MVTAKLAFVLVQVGSNLWVNPMQVQGIALNTSVSEPDRCLTYVLLANKSGSWCSDWSPEKIRAILENK